jgi:hypothetical protein
MFEIKIIYVNDKCILLYDISEKIDRNFVLGLCGARIVFIKIIKFV